MNSGVRRLRGWRTVAETSGPRKTDVFSVAAIECKTRPPPGAECCVLCAGQLRRRPWGRIAGGRAPHGTRESSSNSWRREHHRNDVPPHVPSRRDWGFVEPGSVRLHHRGVGFLDRYGTGGFRAATFFATPRVSREALDHRLLAP